MKVISLQTGTKEDIDKNREHIAQLYRSLIKSSGTEDENTDQKIKGIAERLKGKPGRMRMNIMGKRVNYCSRSVISGDPTISLD